MPDRKSLIRRAQLRRRQRSRALVALAVLALPAVALGEDRKAPPPPDSVRVQGGEDWRSRGDFTVTWSNPDHPSPIDLAYYRLCPVDGQRSCTDAKQEGRDIHQLRLSLPNPGDYTLSVWLKDTKGNSDGANRSEVVHLRLDDEPPRSPGIERGSNGDPALLTLKASDELSGLSDSELELRPSNGGSWQSLPTHTQTPDEISARIPDLDLPDGTYGVRALVRDQAGNLSVIDHDTAGHPMRVALPLRGRTGVAATAQVTRLVRRCRAILVRVAGRPRRRRVVCRNVAVRAPVSLPTAAPLRVGAAERLLVSGSVSDAPNGAAIDIVERPRTPGAPERRSHVALDSGGHFQLVLAPGPSRTLELAYPGDENNLPSSAQATLLVPAASSLIANRRTAFNGQAVLFSGRLLGAPVPDIGRTVDLQAYYRGTWRTFATPRTDSSGAWSYAYRFGATRGTVSYPFRVLIQRDAGYPYETGVSRTLRILVRGR